MVARPPISVRCPTMAAVSEDQDKGFLFSYQSINLCTILYKICTNLMVKRLKHILPHLICPEQGAFVRGRSITDDVMVTQKFIYDLWRARGRCYLMAIKLDKE